MLDFRGRADLEEGREKDQDAGRHGDASPRHLEGFPRAAKAPTTARSQRKNTHRSVKPSKIRSLGWQRKPTLREDMKFLMTKKKRGRLLHESMAVDSWHPSVSLMCDCTHPTLAAWFSLSACKGPFMASSCVPVLNEDGLEGSLRVGNLKGP